MLFALQPTLEHRFESYFNYCDLFNYILSKFRVHLNFEVFTDRSLLTGSIYYKFLFFIMKHFVLFQIQMNLFLLACPINGCGTLLTSLFIRLVIIISYLDISRFSHKLHTYMYLFCDLMWILVPI